MTSTRGAAPSAREIEGRFRRPATRLARPVILGGLHVLGKIRGFDWTADGSPALENLPRPFLLAANHVSHADTAAILGTLPPSIRERTCVAAALDVFGSAEGARPIKALKREMLQTIVAGGFRAFAFDRHGSPRRSLRTAIDLVREGWNVLLYPEGTRSRNGTLGPFKAGVGVLARATGRPVIPVNVRGGSTILPCGVVFPRPGHIRVRYGDPLMPRHDESSAAFTSRLATTILELGPEREPVIETVPTGSRAAVVGSSTR